MTPLSRAHSASPRELLQHAALAFTNQFHTPPQFAAIAPGRVNLIGDHTDYCGGFVLPLAINHWTIAVAATTPPDRQRIVASIELACQQPILDHPTAPLDPQAIFVNLVSGTLALGAAVLPKLPRLDILIHSTVPIGSGLASSAALCAAVATLLEQSSGTRLDPIRKAILCQRVENEFANMPCGLMDQLIITHAHSGHALLINTSTNFMQHIALPSESEATILVVNTGIRHALAQSEYPARRQQCESAARTLGIEHLAHAPAASTVASKLSHEQSLLAQHVVSESQRTADAAAALLRHDLKTLGTLMFQSHASLRDLFRVSCAELDLIVHEAHKLIARGVIGARMTGGGFGGCAIVLCATGSVASITNHILQCCRTNALRNAAVFPVRPIGACEAISLDR